MVTKRCMGGRRPVVQGGTSAIPRPEDRARQQIDGLLTAAGWRLQDRDQFDRHAGLGVALREQRLADGWTDYLLFVEGKAAGVIEAKKAGTTLSGVEAQTSRYIHEPPAGLAKWGDPLPFAYESTGVETFFRDERDPSPRSRRLFAFHQPATLLDWLKGPDTLRTRLRAMPPLPPPVCVTARSRPSAGSRSRSPTIGHAR